MRTIYIKFWDPKEIMDPPFPPDPELKKLCFRAYKYKTEFQALEAYANTMCTWSTLKDDTTNVQEFIDQAWDHIKAQDYDWLEKNFT